MAGLAARPEGMHIAAEGDAGHRAPALEDKPGRGMALAQAQGDTQREDIPEAEAHRDIRLGEAAAVGRTGLAERRIDLGELRTGFEEHSQGGIGLGERRTGLGEDHSPGGIDLVELHTVLGEVRTGLEGQSQADIDLEVLRTALEDHLQAGIGPGEHSQAGSSPELEEDRCGLVGLAAVDRGNSPAETGDARMVDNAALYAYQRLYMQHGSRCIRLWL
jgi:hypothetical protein